MSHGSSSAAILAPRSRFYHGPFGRLCENLPPWSPPGFFSTDEPGIDAFLLDYATGTMVEAPGFTSGEIAADADERKRLDEKFDSKIPAGYTYFGQFVDHDITFDPASSLVRQNDPNMLHNFRTPRLDLDNVYGRGPHDQPYMFDPEDGAKMAIGKIDGTDLPDLPRFGKRALIGDMRNDENSIVSQLQLAFLLAHNTLVDRARVLAKKEKRKITDNDAFEQARRTLRWLYQHIVWNDFLPRIVVDDVYKAALTLKKTPDGRKIWQAGLKDVYNWKKQPYMPVEFAGAAYRFGHTMVRNSYQTNAPERGFGEFAPIFDNNPGLDDPDDLRGFRPLKAKNAIQWDWFLDMKSSRAPFFPQFARKIDTKLSNALFALHEGPAGDKLNILAYRNLKRGWALGLPSGTAMAEKFNIKLAPLHAKDIDALWYYVLREAEASPSPGMGRLGSTIIAAVFAGLLKGDPHAWINVNPGWTPGKDPLLKSGANGDNRDDKSWTLASIIRIAGIKADGVGLE